jgi:hypothetical protein
MTVSIICPGSAVTYNKSERLRGKHVKVVRIICLGAGLTMLVCYIVCMFVQEAHGQITANVLRRTLFICTPSLQTGTAFTIDVDGKQYLVTAKHIVSTLPEGADTTISILKKVGWTPITVQVFKCNDPVDIAIAVPKAQLTVNQPLSPTSSGLIVGQDTHFYGFPYSNSTVYASLPDVFGLVKRATVSQIQSDPVKGIQCILLDGYNNPGFSGSPVVFHDLLESGVGLKVAGVISSYMSEHQEVKEKVCEVKVNEVTPADIAGNNILHSPDGKLYRLKGTDKYVQANTGIAQAWDISAAVDLIRKHPTGPISSDTFTGL